MTTTAKERYVLFTNLMFVTIGDVRLHVDALLLADQGTGGSGPRYRVRGFGTESAWPVFDFTKIESIEHEVVPARSRVMIFGDVTPSPTSLLTGAILRLRGAPEIHLVAHDAARAIDVSQYEGDEHTILKVWRALEMKVAHYWTRPAMPRLLFLPPQLHEPSRAAQWGDSG